MVLHMMKYSELNFPVRSDFGKIRNYTIIHNVIHFGVLWESLNMLLIWDMTCFVGVRDCFEGFMHDNLIVPLFFRQILTLLKATHYYTTSTLLQYYWTDVSYGAHGDETKMVITKKVQKLPRRIPHQWL